MGRGKKNKDRRKSEEEEGRAKKRKGEIRGEGGGMYSLSDTLGITQCAMDPFL